MPENTATKATHTPGPWSSSKDGSTVYGPSHRHPQSIELGVQMQSEPIVCFVCGYHGSVEAEANARLIAAAPELLEIVRALHEWYTAATDGNHKYEGPLPYSLLFDDERDLQEHIEAVIAKTEGRS